MSDVLIRHHGRKPIGGHHFPSGATVLKAEDIDQLLLEIETFRAQSNQPLGEPESDLVAHYQKVAPFLVEKGDPLPSTQDTPVKLAEALLRFYQQRRAILEPSSPIFSERLARCHGCPFFARVGETLSQKRPYVRIAIRKGIVMTADASLEHGGYCRHFIQYVRMVCRLDRPEDAKELQDAPKVCWLATP